MNTGVKIALLGGAAYLAYEWLKSSATAAQSSATPATTGTTTTTQGAPATATPGSLQTAYNNFVARINAENPQAGTGVNLTLSPWQFNYYMQEVENGWYPDLNALFPGIDNNAPMPLATYWAKVGPALAQAKGLAGLGMLLRGAGRPVQ